MFFFLFSIIHYTSISRDLNIQLLPLAACCTCLGSSVCGGNVNYVNLYRINRGSVKALNLIHWTLLERFDKKKEERRVEKAKQSHEMRRINPPLALSFFVFFQDGCSEVSFKRFTGSKYENNAAICEIAMGYMLNGEDKKSILNPR